MNPTSEYKKIAWIDSVGNLSTIHLTADGVETICGGHSYYIANRVLSRRGSRTHGYSNYCPTCFRRGGKGLKWDSRI